MVKSEMILYVNYSSTSYIFDFEVYQKMLNQGNTSLTFNGYSFVLIIFTVIDFICF